MSCLVKNDAKARPRQAFRHGMHGRCHDSRTQRNQRTICLSLRCTLHPFFLRGPKYHGPRHLLHSVFPKSLAAGERSKCSHIERCLHTSHRAAEVYYRVPTSINPNRADTLLEGVTSFPPCGLKRSTTHDRCLQKPKSPVHMYRVTICRTLAS
ncbi:hypothetical protein CC80DRAFT_105767 [Byssothecium circinans]|uniref:Uncharacterized protein n=1 Tax=Byssothecium circinans TaxID=147558 RepID=A0A6A5UH69_9PLEO|nr:hypothetical protein CC80DRAFT_105767 [Byssothecium circinans]